MFMVAAEIIFTVAAVITSMMAAVIIIMMALHCHTQVYLALPFFVSLVWSTRALSRGWVLSRLLQYCFEVSCIGLPGIVLFSLPLPCFIVPGLRVRNHLRVALSTHTFGFVSDGQTWRHHERQPLAAPWTTTVGFGSGSSVAPYLR